MRFARLADTLRLWLAIAFTFSCIFATSCKPEAPLTESLVSNDLVQRASGGDAEAQFNLNPAVEPLENGSLTLAATSYKTGTCHPKGELRSSWISPAYNCLQLEWGFNCRI
jgi:hypothetical protein